MVQGIVTTGNFQAAVDVQETVCFIHVLIYSTALANNAIITFRSISDFIHPHVIGLTDPKLSRVWITLTWFAC